MENFYKWKNQLDYFLEDRKYPSCNNCSKKNRFFKKYNRISMRKLLPRKRNKFI